MLETVKSVSLNNLFIEDIQNMSKLMLINTIEGHECRIAVLAENKLQELYSERASAASQVGNIYKGRVTNIEPSIQAAFIDYGGPKNGFLHISDLHPKYFPTPSRQLESVGRRSSHKSRPPMQECLRPGQEVVVQMTKEGIGTKGPTMTTYLSIPGRLLVTMPDMAHIGISRKIEDEEDRDKIKEILAQLEVPENLGVIVRTAGIGRTKRDLQRDLAYLTRLWKAVNDRIAATKAPAEIYKESDLVIRTLRDVYDADIKRIICDSRDVAQRVCEFLDFAGPRTKCKIQYYTGDQGLFREFGVEEEIRKINSRRVELSNGGSIVIDQTEALVAIDVNSGSYRQHKSAELNALYLNLAAADEIARQLRLRDMGGVIVIDFVDMREEKNRRELEKKLRDLLKEDRAKNKVLKISNFGLIQMTRQRLRPSLKQSIFKMCPYCDGTGMVLSNESVALSVIRNLKVACASQDVASIELAVAPEVAHYLLNSQRQIITDIEHEFRKTITVTSRHDLSGNDVHISCINNRGAEVSWDIFRPKTPKQLASLLVEVKNDLTLDTEQDNEPESNPLPVADRQTDQPQNKQQQPREKNMPAQPQPSQEKSKRKRPRRKKKHQSMSQPQLPQNEIPGEIKPAVVQQEILSQQPQQSPVFEQLHEHVVAEDAQQEEHAKKSRRRGKRGGRKRHKAKPQTNENAVNELSEHVSEQLQNEDE